VKKRGQDHVDIKEVIIAKGTAKKCSLLEVLLSIQQSMIFEEIQDHWSV
jgi:hypothetical protein